MTVVMTCFNCQRDNQRSVDSTSIVKEFKPYVFGSFSEAHKHMMENPEHYVDITIQETDEE